MERLTKAEEQVMQVLWKLGPAFAKDVLAAMPAPRPAITTVSTIIRILEEKGFVAHEAYGRSHRYHAVVSKQAYGDRSVKKLLKDYFGGSPTAMLSAFIEREQLDASDLDGLLKLIRDHKKKR
ncbi:MAG: BlaI/MecI/CopY family transcriptional regulator [Flavobacteriales bacterium]|nr:BlaI/MecI/CopY family transcriptional regulator [Flavobacteriales bacterium]